MRSTRWRYVWFAVLRPRLILEPVALVKRLLIHLLVVASRPRRRS